MKNIFRKATAAAALAAGAIASASPSGWISTDVKNNYTGAGFGMAFGDYAVVQTDVGVNVGKGSLDVWTNYDSNLKRINEHDLTFAYPVGVKDLTAKLSGIYLTFPGTSFKDAVCAEATLSHSKLPGVSLTLDKCWSPGSGNGYSAKIAYDKSIPLSASTSLDFGLAAIANSHLYTDATGPAVVATSIGLSKQLTKNLSIKASARYQSPVDNGKFGNTFRTRKTFGIGFNYNFGGK
ncbi:MAG TPA: hypothetical protein VHA12_03430 [Candidatus Nanoarchaeia archaeon]|nr:hypothetical protein [Candidatus Nanoarchaeia archaeon]